MKFLTQTNLGEPDRKRVEAWLRECAIEFRSAGQLPQAEAIDGSLRWWSTTELPSTSDITATGREMVKEFVRVRKTRRATGTWAIIPDPALA